jgi:hypothetical protein
MSGRSTAKNVFTFILVVLQVVAAAVILWLIADKLYKYDVNVSTQSVHTASCALDKNGAKSDSLCVIGFAAVGITAAVLVATSLILVRTCQLFQLWKLRYALRRQLQRALRAPRPYVCPLPIEFTARVRAALTPCHSQNSLCMDAQWSQ